MNKKKLNLFAIILILVMSTFFIVTGLWLLHIGPSLQIGIMLNLLTVAFVIITMIVRELKKKLIVEYGKPYCFYGKTTHGHLFLSSLTETNSTLHIYEEEEDNVYYGEKIEIDKALQPGSYCILKRKGDLITGEPYLTLFVSPPYFERNMILG